MNVTFGLNYPLLQTQKRGFTMKNYITFAKKDDRVLPYEKPHRYIAYKAATEGIVLLENNGILPLNLNKNNKIALFGAGARKTIKGGSGSGEVNERYSTSIYEGLEEAGFQITTTKWLDDYDADFEQAILDTKKEISAALKKFDSELFMKLFLRSYSYPYGRKIRTRDVIESITDTCIYVVARQSSESEDRKLDNFDYTLSEIEKENIRICTQNYKNTIVVLNVGASFDTSFMDEISGISALIYFCQQGTDGGTALADILTGKVTPSGKLVDTWVKSYQDVPFGKKYGYLSDKVNEADYLEDIYVGYRYYDTFQIVPRYPFGYGLSYTSFSIDYKSIKRINHLISVTVSVKNIGTNYAGKEVVQLYVNCPSGTLSKEYQRLCAFAKTKTLAPNEEQLLTLTFPLSYLTSYDDASASSILEQGDYLLRVGNHSRNTNLCAFVHLPETICYTKHKNICPQNKQLQVLHADSSVGAFDLPQNLDSITVLPTNVETTVYQYEELPVCTSKKRTEKLQSLTVKERISLVIGAGILDQLMNSSYLNIPGVAGNTTSSLLDKEIVNIAFADGPAGLRLQRRSTITKDGTAKMIDTQFHMMQYYPDALKQIMCGNPKKDKVYYQYTTAFPVATAMAQTWNVDLLEEMGEAVAEEMKEYGVTFWLAPALNIHRNPLCGRNYEYYSEDPILSGKMAASITKGVQKTKGCFVTLKHFVANNQETNREYSSSNMTERALREIYLKGFEIAVCEGHAKGVMSSYNKINGVYASNSKDLLTDVLRHEWRFDGLVMTDWIATGKGKSDPAKCISAGNDLIMPGSSYDKKRIEHAIGKQEISRKDLNRCAGNVLKAIEEGCAV